MRTDIAFTSKDYLLLLHGMRIIQASVDWPRWHIDQSMFMSPAFVAYRLERRWQIKHSFGDVKKSKAFFLSWQVIDSASSKYAYISAFNVND